MQALYPRWSNTAIRVVLLVAVAGLAAIPVVLMIYVRTPYVTQQLLPVDQPVEFDHRHHVQDDEIDCRYCHQTAERAATAGIPATEVCMGCHNQVWNASPLLEPVRRSWFSATSLPYNRVHDLPDFVYFDHSIHVTKGVGCVTCHGRVDQMPRVLQVAPLTMNWCLDCHRNPAPHLRPGDRIVDMTWTQPSPEVGEQLIREHSVDPPTHCTGCHR